MSIQIPQLSLFNSENTASKLRESITSKTSNIFASQQTDSAKSLGDTIRAQAEARKNEIMNSIFDRMNQTTQQTNKTNNLPQLNLNSQADPAKIAGNFVFNTPKTATNTQNTFAPQQSTITTSKPVNTTAIPQQLNLNSQMDPAKIAGNFVFNTPQIATNTQNINTPQPATTINKTGNTTTNPVNTTDNKSTVLGFVQNKDRQGYSNWAKGKSIKEINEAVASLSPDEKRKLAETVLQTNATGDTKEKLLNGMTDTLSNPDMGFFSEVWSYTNINMKPGGYNYSNSTVNLDPDGFNKLDAKSAKNTLMHESFHSFNDKNGGPKGSLDEGSSIWIFKTADPSSIKPGESWAEATFGTKNYYRDIGLSGYPKDLELSAPANPTQKLKDVYNTMQQKDPTKLPWNSTSKLQSLYDKYYKPLNRNVPYEEWLKQTQSANSGIANETK